MTNMQIEEFGVLGPVLGPKTLKVFKTETNIYIYNPYTNYIALYSGDDITLLRKQIEEYERKNVISARIVFPNKKEVYKHSDKGIKRIIIEITNECNLRCRYCFLGSSYFVEKNYCNKVIPEKIARKAIDYYLAHSPQEKNIGFYGGEPFMQFNLIKKLITYYKRPNVKFFITTNGTILSKEIIRFLIKNEVQLAVSLDDPEQFHNRYRVTKSGKGSYDLVLKNLKKIYDLNKKYVEKNVLILGLLAPPFDTKKLDEVISFFNNLKQTFSLSGIRINFLQKYGTTFYKSVNFPIKKELIERKKYKKQLVEKLIKGEHVPQFVKHAFLRDIMAIEKRIMGSNVPLISHTCIPGVSRLFVDVDGYFYPCEKVGSHLCIGDVQTGIDIDRAFYFFERFKSLVKDCSKCWAVRFCPLCIFFVYDENDDISEDRKRAFCEGFKRELEYNFILFLRAKENNINVS